MILLAAATPGITQADPDCSVHPIPANPAGFVIRHGTNLSHWLSQDFGWVPKDEWITQRDIEFIASCGFDHVRLPVDEFELWNEDGSAREDNFARLTQGIEWCRAANLRVILDMHVLRSHHFNAANEGGSNTLFTDPQAQQHLADLWKDLSHRYGNIPVSELAYEIMNEPVADDNEEWNALVALVLKQIRVLEPSRVVVIGANRWQIPQNVPALKFPEGDKNIIISFHTYTPMLFTHYTADWTPLKFYKGPVSYPGPIVSKEDYDKIRAEIGEKAVFGSFIEEARENWGPERLLQVYEPAIKRARELGLQLYCGEFGCMPTVPREARMAYYRDIVRVYAENGIAYANWEYKGDFGIFEWHGKRFATGAPDVELISILTHPCKK